jgi:hypothetical protein
LKWRRRPAGGGGRGGGGGGGAPRHGKTALPIDRDNTSTQILTQRERHTPTMSSSFFDEGADEAEEGEAEENGIGDLEDEEPGENIEQSDNAEDEVGAQA